MSYISIYLHTQFLPSLNILVSRTPSLFISVHLLFFFLTICLLLKRFIRWESHLSLCFKHLFWVHFLDSYLFKSEPMPKFRPTMVTAALECLDGWTRGHTSLGGPERVGHPGPLISKQSFKGIHPLYAWAWDGWICPFPKMSWRPLSYYPDLKYLAPSSPPSLPMTGFALSCIPSLLIYLFKFGHKILLNH